MDTTKSIFASKTFWGAIIAVLSGVAAILGHAIAPADQAVLVDSFSSVGTIVGSFIAIWGRYTATKTIA